MEEQTSSTGATRKRTPAKRTVPLVDTKVRRSDRQKSNSNGLKSPSCPIMNCFYYKPSPPTLPPKAIRNLGVQFCGMEPDDLTDDKLMKNKGKVGKPIKKKSKKDGSNDKWDTSKASKD